MKKSTIWILSAVMAIAFLGLLWMQVTYFKTSMQMRNDQFNEAVSRSLNQVSKNLEVDQTKKFLESGIEDAKKKYEKERVAAAAAAKRHTQPQEVTQKATKELWGPTGEFLGSVQLYVTQTVKAKPVKAKKSEVLLPNRGSSSISTASFEMQEVIKQRYDYQRQIVDEVIYNLVNTPSTRSIEDRIDFAVLRKYIANELRFNGIETKFQAEIVKYNSEEVVFGEME